MASAAVVAILLGLASCVASSETQCTDATCSDSFHRKALTQRRASLEFQSELGEEETLQEVPQQVKVAPGSPVTQDVQWDTKTQSFEVGQANKESKEKVIRHEEQSLIEGKAGLQETIERAQSWRQQGSKAEVIEGLKLVKARMPRQSSAAEGVSVDLAVEVSSKYVESLQHIGTHKKLGSYFDQFCERFEVEDPVGTWKRTKKWELVRVLQYRKNLVMPQGFEVSLNMITVAQEHAYTAVHSTMMVQDITVNRTDFLTISPLGCVKRVKAYWSLAGSLLRTQITKAQQETKDAILGYLKALDELGTGKSLDYFGQYADNFEVHDPFGTAPMTMVAELQKVIPEMGAALAPNGFTVTVEDVTVSVDPKFGTAHLVLHLIGIADVDIIDIFEIEKGKVKNLKAVWHIPAM